MGRKSKRQLEEYLIKDRRKQIAELVFEERHVAVEDLANKYKVDVRTIYRDIEHIENHAEDLMKDYLVKTVPYIINKSVYQIGLVNRYAIEILKASDSTNKEKLSAGALVAKTARDVVEIIAGNKGVVDKALDLDESTRELIGSEQDDEQEQDDKEEDNTESCTTQQQEGQEKFNELLSGDSAQEQKTRDDPQAVF